MVVGCQPHEPAAFTPRDIPGTHFHEGLSWLQGHGLEKNGATLFVAVLLTNAILNLWMTSVLFESKLSWYMIYDIFVNCNWFDTRWQQYSTHLHTNSTQNNTMIQNTQNITCITIRIHKHKIKIHNLHKQKHTNHTTLLSNFGSTGRDPSLRVMPWHLPYNWGKSMEKPQLG
jgi:hypothetical protein